MFASVDDNAAYCAAVRVTMFFTVEVVGDATGLTPGVITFLALIV